MRVKFVLSCNLLTRTFFIVAETYFCFIYFRNELANGRMDGVVFPRITFITILSLSASEKIYIKRRKYCWF